MPEFPEALDRALRLRLTVRGIRSGADTARGLAARLGALERAYGGRKGAAAAAGVPRVSWDAWRAPRGSRSHRTPGRPNAAKIDAAYSALIRHQTAQRAARRGAPQIRSMAVTAEVVADPKRARYRNKAAHRVFRADKVASWRPVVDAWMTGQAPEQVAAEAGEVIARAYGQEFAFEGDDVIVDVA